MNQNKPVSGKPTKEEIDQIIAEKLKELAQYDDSNDHGYRCSYCGYELKEAVLPKDYLCPLCERGAHVFKKF